jgi:hypothetical protein
MVWTARLVGAGLTAVAAIATMAAAPGCKRGERARTAEVRAQVMTCARALTDAEAGAADAVAVVARGCAEACPGLEAYASAGSRVAGVRALLAGCALACDDDAARAFEQASSAQRFSSLVAACGPAYYGLSTDDAALLSGEWWVLHRIGDWLDRARPALAGDEEALAALEHATSRAHFPLPLPARLPGAYALPEAEHRAEPEPSFYVIVGADGVRAAARPVARLRGANLERRPVPGGAFPGQRVDDDALGAHYAELVEQWAGVHGGDAQAIDGRPLLLADGALPVTRLVAVATATGQPQVWLGVAGGGVPAPHRIALERIPSFGSAAPILELRADRVILPGEPAGTEVPFADGDARLRDEMVTMSVMHAPVAKLELRYDDEVTVAKLAAVVDAAAAARLGALIFAPSAP